MPRLRIKAIEKKVLSFFNESFGLENLDEIRGFHYSRNDNQPTNINYLDIVRGRYSLVSDSKSALHRLDMGSDIGNGLNSKWLSADGRDEYVFRYVGSEKAGQFELVRSSLNQGTYNFVPASRPFGHEKADIYPWILWGNTSKDSRTWTAQERNAAYNNSIADGVVDTLFGFNPIVTRRGGPADNFWDARSISESFSGGGGWDMVSYKNSDYAVVLSLADGKGYEGAARGDTFSSIEEVIGSNAGDILVGSNEDNRLSGLGGNDIIAGGPGKDHIKGASQNDILHGDSGSDKLWGGAGVDRLYGGAQNDFLVGDGGRDRLWGDEGKDILKGGGDDDFLFGGSGTDKAIFNGARSDYVVTSSGSKTLVDGRSVGDGLDILRSVELLQFQDGTYRTKNTAERSVELGERFTIQGHYESIIEVDDYNRDGIRDIALGGGNQVTVISGKNGRLLKSFAYSQDQFADFGDFLAGYEDRDGDGKAEILVGAPGEGGSNWTSGDGAVHVLSIKKGQILLSVDAPRPLGLDYFGSRLLTIGDADNDGVSDFLASDGPALSNGYVSLISGASGNEIYFLDDLAYTATDFGSEVLRIGDLDDDGIDDALIMQSTHVFQDAMIGAYSGVDGKIIYQVVGDDWGYNGGYFTLLGDVNGDGFDEFVVERNQVVGDQNRDGSVDSNPPTDSSYPLGTYIFASVFSGKDGRELSEIVIDSVNERTSLLAAGDFDGDGEFEILVRGNSDPANELRLIDLEGDVIGRVTSPSLADDYYYSQRFGQAVQVVIDPVGEDRFLALLDFQDETPVTRFYELG